MLLVDDSSSLAVSTSCCCCPVPLTVPLSCAGTGLRRQQALPACSMSKAAASVWSACIKALDSLAKTKQGAPAHTAALSRASTALAKLNDLPSCTAKEWKTLVQRLKVGAVAQRSKHHGHLLLLFTDLALYSWSCRCPTILVWCAHSVWRGSSSRKTHGS